MITFRSLSTKIIATVFALVAVAFVADLVLNRSISTTVNNRTKELTDQMFGIVDEKDSEIKKLLGQLLSEKESSQTLKINLSENELIAEGHGKESFLQGQRFGILTSAASLVSSAMMSGEASSVQDLFDTLLQNKDIAAINLWRTDGHMAFRDNATIEAVNKFTESDAFQPRKPKTPITLEGNRAEALKRTVENNSNNESINAEIENDEGEMIPVTYSYLPLTNKEECHGCHAPDSLPRGVLEVAVPNAELLALKAKSQKMIEQMEIKRTKTIESLKEVSKTERKKLADKTLEYTTTLKQANDEIKSARTEASVVSIGSKIVFFFITLFVLLVMLRGLLTKPLKGINDAMRALADNNLSVTIPSLNRKDEIGDMAQAVTIFKENAVERQRLEAENKERTHKQHERQRMIETMLNEFREQVQQSLQAVSQNAQQMKSSAMLLNKIAANTSDRAKTANVASGHSADNVQSVAAATDEMTVSISEIGRQINQVSTLISSASTEAQDANRKVSGLEQAVDKIGEVVSLIQDIAEQTNLLALNATIEAARAGDAGRGFAVVAQEVKQLASQTSKATEEVVTHIDTIQSETSSSVVSIQSIASKMDEINQFTSAIGAAAEQQNASTSEISRNIQEAAHETKLVLDNITDVTVSSEETNTSAAQVNEAAQNVADVAKELQHIIDSFLDRVAAA